MTEENMKLRFLNGMRQGETVDVGQSVSIGRDQSCDITLEEDGVSRHHCRIYYAGGVWFVEDLGSTNGVKVNGDFITEKKTLQPGDRIGVHHRLFLFISESQVVDAEQLAAYEAIAHGGSEESVAWDASRSESAGAEAKLRSRWQYFAMAVGAFFFVLVLIGIFTALNKTDKQSQQQSPQEQVEEKDSVEDSESEEDFAYEIGNGEKKPMNFSDATSEDESDTYDTPSDFPSAALIRSSPPEAEVTIDGEKRGKTPVVLRDLEEGEHQIKLSLAGYEAVARKIRMQEKMFEQKFQLRKKPGTVFFYSDPSGATVKEKGQILGETPFCRSDLSEGQHEVSFLLYGYKKQQKSFELDPSKAVEVRADLTSKLGTLKILTMPPYCRISVAGRYQGTTTPQQEADHNRSQPLKVTNLRPGRVQVRAVHPLGAEKRKKVNVRTGKAEMVLLRLWVRDIQVELKNGKKVAGLFLYKEEGGNLALRTKAGDQRQYAQEEIAQVRRFGPAAKTEPITERTTADKAEHADKETSLSPEEAFEKDSRSVEEGEKQRNSDTPMDGSENGPSAKSPPADAHSVEQVLSMLENSGAGTDIQERIDGNELVVHGVPKKVQNTGIRTVLTLHSKVKGEMAVAAYNAHKEQLNNAIQDEETVSLRGVPVVKNGVFWLRRAEVASPDN